MDADVLLSLFVAFTPVFSGVLCALCVQCLSHLYAVVVLHDVDVSHACDHLKVCWYSHKCQPSDESGDIRVL